MLTWHWPYPADLSIVLPSFAAVSGSSLCLVSLLWLRCARLQPGSSLQFHAGHPANAAAAAETDTTTRIQFHLQCKNANVPSK